MISKLGVDASQRELERCRLEGSGPDRGFSDHRPWLVR